VTSIGRAVVVLDGEGELVTALGSRYRDKVVGSSTEGAYSLASSYGTRIVGPPVGPA